MTLNFLEILIKLALGLFSLVFVINVTGKGNLAPNSAIDQIQNYVLGGIIGGVIYNSSINILQYAVILIMWTILVLTLKCLNNNVRAVKHLIDGNSAWEIDSRSLPFCWSFSSRCSFEAAQPRYFPAQAGQESSFGAKRPTHHRTGW